MKMSKSLVPSVCPYCAAGCGFYIAVEKDRATGIEYMLEHPASEGALCSKGNASLEVLYSEDRLRYPQVRKGEGWARLSWDEALGLVARRLSRIIEQSGPESVGFLSSSKCTNEENYLVQKLARCLGSPNVDNCARLCHAPSVVGLNMTLGAAAMTNPIPDLANSKCIFIIGSNLAENHPILSRWIHRAKDAGAVVIAADPRLTHTAWLADIFLRIKPGTDVALLNGMANVIVNEGLTDGEFIAKRTRGYSGFAESLRDYTPQRASEITGVPAGDIIRAARAFAISPASSIVYSMGITQHSTGTSNVVAISNLALITGHIGRPGAGIFPLRGQNNVQGACDMGALAEFYPGYRRAEDPETLELFSLAWGVSNLPKGPGLTSTEMIDAALEGGIRALYIVGEDPANSDSHSNRVRDALESLEFLGVQDIFPTATAQLADVLLPAAAWAEKEGTFTSTERRVQWTARAVAPPGEARPDMEIICELAGRMDLGPQFSYPDATSVLSEVNRLVPAYAGITPARLCSCGLVWPCPDAKHPGTPILHAQGFKLEEGRGYLVPVKYQPASEDVSPEYPLLLTTGRVAVHHNAGSMTRRSPSLMEREPELFVEINPADAVPLKVADGDEVIVESARGWTGARARLTERMKKGVVFMPFHFPGTNLLTTDARDPHSKIPQFNVAACRIRRRD